LHFESHVLVPLFVSALIVFASPYVGEIRGALQSSFPGYYRWIIGGAVAIAAAVALGAASLSLRRRTRETRLSATAAGPQPWVRDALMVMAISIGVTYARAVSTGNPDVDLVEAFHFVEYGVVTWLFYRVWRRRPDVSAIALTVCAGLAVGIADEWVQWFVPGRVGEIHDVFLNAVAIVCGLLVSVAIDPPVALSWPRLRSARFALGLVIGCLLTAVAGFVDQVHLGYEINDWSSPVFRSQYDVTALAAAADERAVRWQTSPPPERGFTREDHYLSEGLWHVQRRNLSVTARDWWSAWNENVILERFYAPVLDRGSRWADGQRDEIDRRAHGTAHTMYRSDAAPYPIYLVRRSIFWTVTLLLVAAIVGAARSSGTSDPGPA
jgi:VanZ family protein